MKRQQGGDLVSCVVLAAILVVCVMIRSIVTSIFAVVAAGLLVTELDRSGRLIAVRIVRFGSLVVPRPVREEYAQQWRDQVLCEGEAGLRPVITAITMLGSGIPRIVIRELNRAIDRTICDLRRQPPQAHGSPAGLTWLTAFVGTATLPVQTTLSAWGYRGMSRTVMVAIGASWWLVMLVELILSAVVGPPWVSGISTVVAWAISCLLFASAPLQWLVGPRDPSSGESPEA